MRLKPVCQRASLFFLIMAFMVPLPVPAQPSAISPQDVARLKQRTDFSNEWFDTILFDLQHPVELFVTIQEVHMPDSGYAELLFTIDSIGRGTDETTFDPERVFVATLQLAGTAKRLGANAKSFKRGVEARVWGWPATPENVTSSVLLIDEITFVHGGKAVGKPMRFHLDHPNMKSLRTDE